MKRVALLLSLLLWVSLELVYGQGKADTISETLKAEVFNRFRYLKFGFYTDAYVNLELDGHSDTSNVIPFSSNCPVRDQIRLNVAAVEMYYNSTKVRGKLALQYGDAPNLLAAPEAQFIKTIRQANVGFNVTKRMWVDFGYMFNPISVESSWPVLNNLSTTTLSSYFSPGNVLGIKISYQFNDKFSGGIMTGNPYSLAYKQNNHLAGLIFLQYSPIPNLTLNYNNFWGNQALRNAEIDNNLLYNEFRVLYSPIPNFHFSGQFQFASQTNSTLPPDSTSIASMCSGFFEFKYDFFRYLHVTARYEYFNDPNGFLSGVYHYDGKTTGLSANGMAAGIGYNPVSFGYIRLQYSFIQANKGNLVYYGGTSDRLQMITFTTGIRF